MLDSRTYIRFLIRMDIRGPDECWEWKGPRRNSGYGYLGINYKHVSAHRLSHMLFVGPIPEGLNVLHACDNPPCVNPNHLHVGTNADNMREMWERGRARQGHVYGADSPQARFTVDEVAAMRREYFEHEASTTDLSQKYGAPVARIRMVLRGDTYPYPDGQIRPLRQTGSKHHVKFADAILPNGELDLDIAVRFVPYEFKLAAQRLNMSIREYMTGYKPGHKRCLSCKKWMPREELIPHTVLCSTCDEQARLERRLRANERARRYKHERVPVRYRRPRKLDLDKAQAIRRAVQQGERQVDLAREYGVSPQVICMIVANKTWREDAA